MRVLDGHHAARVLCDDLGKAEQIGVGGEAIVRLGGRALPARAFEHPANQRKDLIPARLLVHGHQRNTGAVCRRADGVGLVRDLRQHRSRPMRDGAFAHGAQPLQRLGFDDADMQVHILHR